MIDIILFAILAAFLVYRLYDILGTDDDNDLHEPKQGKEWSQMFQEDEKGQKEDPFEMAGRKTSYYEQYFTSNHVASDLLQNEHLSNSFSPEEFLEGSRKAYAIIVEAFCEGNKMILQKFLSSEIYSEFELVIKERESKFISQKLNKLDIIGCKIDRVFANSEKDIQISVMFESEMEAKVVDQSDPANRKETMKVDTLDHIWTFAKNQTESGPNWILVETD